MTNHNTVILRGRLTADPVKVDLENSEISKFTIANNRDYFNSTTKEKREEVSFFDCNAFGSLAKLANEYLKKGRSVLVTGHLKQDKWEDKESGEKRSKVVIVLDNFEFLDSGERSDKSDNTDSAPPPEKKSDPKPQGKKRPF